MDGLVPSGADMAIGEMAEVVPPYIATMRVDRSASMPVTVARVPFKRPVR